MKDQINNITKEHPEIIDSPIKMDEANTPIIIHEGPFVIKNNEYEVIIDGVIQFDWFPNSGVVFSGTPRNNAIEVVTIFRSIDKFDLLLDELYLGKGYIVTLNIGSTVFIKGEFSDSIIKGDKSIIVNKIRFSIPNFRDFRGIATRRVSEEGVYCSRSRLVFDNDDFVITIDKCYNYDKLKDSLDSKGGYVIQYAGELYNHKRKISINEANEILHCFNTFISFLNGRRTSAIFIHGIFEDETIWCDYSSSEIDIYKSVFSWPKRNSIDGLIEIWQKFSKLWNDTDDRNFLISAIHWYVEANSNSGYAEGSIIMAQTALELIYNWLLIENKKILIGKDAENINASNKIRLLLSYLKIDYNVPDKFKYLISYITDNKDIIDAPDAIVQIRNAIIHSQEEKRKKLSSLHPLTKYEALQLCIWYIEMSLLYLLGYEDKYNNRCSFQNLKLAEEYVPWKKL